MTDRLRRLSILVVDDDVGFTPVYERFLRDVQGHIVDVVCSPGEALRLCERTLYDVVVCDTKMPYKGSPLGGVVLGEELSHRFGTDSVLLISQIVDSVAVRAINTDLPFIKKGAGSGVDRWLGDTLHAKIKALVKRQFGFVAMPFGDPELDFLYSRIIVPVATHAGFRVIRVDEEAFTRAIVARIFRLIHDAHFVVCLAVDGNPNAYYEAGYAAALGKEIILCAPRLEDLPFDIRGDKCLNYHGQKQRFTKSLQKLLTDIRFPRSY